MMKLGRNSNHPERVKPLIAPGATRGKYTIKAISLGKERSFGKRDLVRGMETGID